MAGESKGLVVTSQHQGDSFTITTFIPPRRNGGPNVGAYGAVMSLLATVVPDAYDPEPVPLAAEQIALADGVTATGAGLLPHNIAFAAIRDGAVPPEDDEGEPYPIPGCASGACQGD